MVVAGFVNAFRNNYEIVDYNLQQQDAYFIKDGLLKIQNKINSNDNNKLEIRADGGYAIYVIEQKGWL